MFVFVSCHISSCLHVPLFSVIMHVCNVCANEFWPSQIIKPSTSSIQVPVSVWLCFGSVCFHLSAWFKSFQIPLPKLKGGRSKGPNELFFCSCFKVTSSLNAPWGRGTKEHGNKTHFSLNTGFIFLSTIYN